MYKLVHLDNQTSYGQKNVGVSAPFSFDGTMFYFADMHSSTVSGIIMEDAKMIVATRNSIYTFEKVA